MPLIYCGPYFKWPRHHLGAEATCLPSVAPLVVALCAPRLWAPGLMTSLPSLLPPWGIVPSARCRPVLHWLLCTTPLLPHLMTSCYPLRNRPVSDTSRAFKTFTFLGFNVRYAALLVEIPVTCINLEDEHTDDAIWYLVQEDLIPCRCLLLYILSAKVFN